MMSVDPPELRQRSVNKWSIIFFTFQRNQNFDLPVLDEAEDLFFLFSFSVLVIGGAGLWWTIMRQLLMLCDP